MLAAHGVGAAEFRTALADVEVVPGQEFPRWARVIGELLKPSAGPALIPALAVGEVLRTEEVRAAQVDAGSIWSLSPHFEPLLQLGTAHLDGLARKWPDTLSLRARRMLLAQLARKWSSVCVQLFFHRFAPADLLDDHRGPLDTTPLQTLLSGQADPLDRWARLFDAYPVLARVMAVALDHWRAATSEFCGRIVADRAELARHFSRSGQLGEVATIEMDAGDTHDSGRSVAILAFADGTRVVYKPRDLRIAEVYQGVARAISAGGRVLPLHTRTLLLREGYAWEEFVVTADCRAEDEVRRFYRRLGMHARVLQLLDGTDFTGDNLLAVGEHPVLSDLETAIAPRVLGPDPLSPTECEAERRCREFPLRSGIITAPVQGAPGRRPAQVGALGAGGELSPFRQATIRRGASGEVDIVHEYAAFPSNAAVPHLDGRPVAPSDYFEEVVAGYVEAGDELCHQAQLLVHEEGPLAGLTDVPARFLARDTHIYARMLQESLQAPRLRCGIARELHLLRLWRARFRHPGIASVEIDSLRDLDIPLFTAKLGSAALDLGDVGVEQEFFAEAPDQALHGRLEALLDRRCANGEEAVRTALFMLEPERLLPDKPPSSRPTGVSMLGAATRIGDTICEALLVDGEWTHAFGLGYQPTTDTWELGLLGNDLLSGTAGLAVVLAELYHVTKRATYNAAAHGLIRTLIARMQVITSLPVAEPALRAPLCCGALHGWGSWLYGAVRAARGLAAPELVERTISAFAALPLELVLARSPSDFVGGRAGLLTALHATPEAMGHPRLARFAEELAAGLLGGPTPPPPYPETAATLRRFPDPAGGIRLALERSGHAAPRRPSAEASATPATLETAVAALVRDPFRAGNEGLTASAAAPFVGTSGPAGLLDAAELALAGHRRHASAGGATYAETLAMELLAQWRDHGRWFPGLLAPDRYYLSATIGIGAIAHLFLRVQAPTEIGSLRMLDPPGCHPERLTKAVRRE